MTIIGGSPFNSPFNWYGLALCQEGQTGFLFCTSVIGCCGCLGPLVDVPVILSVHVHLWKE